MTNPRKRLLCIIAHEPLFEICYPILTRLKQRDNIDLDVVISSRLLRIDPRYHDIFREQGLSPTPMGRLRMELGMFRRIARADAVFSHGDLLAKPSKHGFRDKFAARVGTKSIFIQHGLVQQRVNWPDEAMPKVQYHSEKLLLWDKVNHWEHSFYDDDIMQKASVVGFPKKSLFPTRKFNETFMKFAQKFEHRLLICANFHEDFRLTEGDKNRFYKLLDDFCTRNPKTLVIYRPHRGRQNDAEKSAMDSILSKHFNIVVSDRHAGDFKYSTINDCLEICDFCISHSSTAVLDAVYFGVPTAVLQNQWLPLEILPQINGLGDIDDFIKSPKQAETARQKLVQYYGETAANLDRASVAIETFLNNA
ncbi:hypothetical protein BFP76_06610 [Amylibacter kogurei]|uniref:UDP-N-acetylglucosamine 2-epimerase domain-containing protein n=1 Tax=Paramylibacter kogurei TaxID=1889778 RepID=A0A2G5K5Z5_9RHOB|nr:hypothetical protein [Amylibacter kogurei]PIB24835.1 hypothetical protein BFP76_06610 [Amylibacter kogurei]